MSFSGKKLAHLELVISASTDVGELTAIAAELETRRERRLRKGKREKPKAIELGELISEKLMRLRTSTQLSNAGNARVSRGKSGIGFQVEKIGSGTTENTMTLPVENQVEIPFASSGSDEFVEARDAIKQEYRASVKLKKLRCRGVEQLDAGDGATLYKLDIGHSVEGDWAWEGASAFRYENFKMDDPGDLAQSADANFKGKGWAGEVVEVDEVNGFLFVSIEAATAAPVSGVFFVRPFDFLQHLNSLYSDPAKHEFQDLLPPRLAASRTGILAQVKGTESAHSIPELKQLWCNSWAAIWGPPGTGKTTKIGQQVAAIVQDPTERILVVSTTNKATDQVACAAGVALLKNGVDVALKGSVRRIGRSPNVKLFRDAGAEGMLKGTEMDLLRQIAALERRVNRTQDKSEKAELQLQIGEIRRQMKDRSFQLFLSPEIKAIFATSFKALSLLNTPEVCGMVTGHKAPFTTVIVDEAGLIPRVTVAALSLLASRRIVLSGDPKQLAPISKVSRVLAKNQANWLANSGLHHLNEEDPQYSGTHFLRRQFRMHPDIRETVSAYQYGGRLIDGESVFKTKYRVPAMLRKQPRSIWYVLDEDGKSDVARNRADRGPGNRSWQRQKSLDVLEKMLGDKHIRTSSGLFITPFVAQARYAKTLLQEQNVMSWSAGSVHSQQGAEADIVVFDTVNAGSCGWPLEEWKRLINVGLSRAREFLVLVASRDEMREPYLQQLTQTMAPRIIQRSRCKEVPIAHVHHVSDEIAQDDHLLGNQIEQRKRLRPLLSFEQQRLCELKLDGKPRMVRGVAGSGKTVVLARWLLKVMKENISDPDARLYAVYANQSLEGMIRRTIENEWQHMGEDEAFPYERVEFVHLREVLDTLLRMRGGRLRGYEYDDIAKQFIESYGIDSVTPVCTAMFVDEAQDMGSHALRLLTALVEQSDAGDVNSRSIHIFYDNAQNIHGRSTPKWTDFGLDMRGRSTVMKESFRSTKPITEYALNVLYKLQPPVNDADHRELIERHLIEETERNDELWWNVRFNQVDGPLPEFQLFRDEAAEYQGIATQIKKWVVEEGVSPSDIQVVYNNKYVVNNAFQRWVIPELRSINLNYHEINRTEIRRDDTAIVGTSVHSFKGYESEIVIVPSVERFYTQSEGVFANLLYVAMTRARSIMSICGIRTNDAEQNKIVTSLAKCREMLADRELMEVQLSSIDEMDDVSRRIGVQHLSWLQDIFKRNQVSYEPILGALGEIVAEPLFHFEVGDHRYACFEKTQLSNSVTYKLEDAGYTVLPHGAAYG